MNKCKAVFYIGDDFGDNEATMRCGLEEGHAGWHTENGQGRKYTFSWEVDERPTCFKCKKQVDRDDRNYCRFCGEEFCKTCMPDKVGEDDLTRSCSECDTKPKCQKHPHYILPCWRCESEQEMKK